jgi:hypothetical protein
MTSKTFEFNYYGNDCSSVSDEFPVRTNITKNIVVDEQATWDVVMGSFVEFLSHCWGYDLSKQVEYKDFSGRLEQLRDEGKLSDEDWEEVKGW